MHLFLQNSSPNERISLICWHAVYITITLHHHFWARGKCPYCMIPGHLFSIPATNISAHTLRQAPPGRQTHLRLSLNVPDHFPVSLLNCTQFLDGRNCAWFALVVSACHNTWHIYKALSRMYGINERMSYQLYLRHSDCKPVF